MARSERRRQKGRARKQRRSAAQRARQRRQETGGSGLADARSVVRHAREYPIHDCVINQAWQEHGIAHIMLSRKQPNGLIAFGSYLVDTYCLGLKDTFCNANLTRATYESDVKAPIHAQHALAACPVPLAHEIIYGAIEYARALGFSPERGFALSKHLLEPEGHFEEKAGVEFGKDGKPLYVSGPHDNVEQIMRTLERSVGDGNFHFIHRVGGSGYQPEAEAWE